MAALAWTFFVAVVLATHTESVPIPDAGDLVVTTTETLTTAPPDISSPSPDVSTTSVSQESKPPPPPPKIYSMHVTSDIEFRFAKTLVSSRVANPANQSQEVSFSVVLPQDAFITGFVMEIDGKSYRAYVKEKEEAKKTYDEAIQQGLAAAHVAYSARESNSFDVSVNIEPMKKVTFNLTYEELLKRSKGLYHHVVTISPGQVVPDMLVKVHIKEPRSITKLYTPKFSSENKVSDVDDDPCSGDSINSSVCTSGNQIARKTVLSSNEAIVEFGPTLEEQKRLAHDKGKGLSGQFEVLYDVQRDPSGGEVLVKDGYFVHFFAPTDLQILPKHIVFVLDVSGSMLGRKIDQVKDAMRTILESLQPDDYFNVIIFSSQVTSWDLDHPEADLITDSDPYFYTPHYPYPDDQSTTNTPTPAPTPREAVPAYPASRDYIQKALKRNKAIEANGGTNIFGGLKQAIKTIKGHRELLKKNGDLKARKSIIMFLTDGEANVGESRPDYIISKLSELNTAPQAPVYSLTFGEDGNIDFLTKLSLANSGLARVIYEGADADIQLKRFYGDISSPLLSDVTFKYLSKEVNLDSTTKLNYHTYYQGGELVVAGRTADKEVQEISADVSAAAKGSSIDRTQYPVKSLPYEEPQITLIDYIIPAPRETVKERPTTSLERAWAYLTVKQLIEEYEAQKHKNPEPVKQQPFPIFTTSAPSSADSSTTLASSNAVTSSSTTSKPENATQATNTTEKPSAKKRALELALKYSFVTKLTSLVVVKPNATQATEAKRIVQGENDGHTAYGGFASGGFGLSALPMFPPPGAALFSSHSNAASGFYPSAAGSSSNGPIALSTAFSGVPQSSHYSNNVGVPMSASANIRFPGFASSTVLRPSVRIAGPSSVPYRSSLGQAAPSTTFAYAAPGTLHKAGYGGMVSPPPPPGLPPPPRPLPPLMSTPASAMAAPGSSSGFPNRKISLVPQPVRGDSFDVDRVDSYSGPKGKLGFLPKKPGSGEKARKNYPQGGHRGRYYGGGGGYRGRGMSRTRKGPHVFRANRHRSQRRKICKNCPDKGTTPIVYKASESLSADVVYEISMTTTEPAITEDPVNLQPTTSNTFDNTTTIAPGPEEPPVLDPLDKLNISDVQWVTPEALTDGTIQLDVKGEKKKFIILSNLNPTTNATDCTAPGISSGKCRHLSQCVLRAVTSSVEAYLPFQCQLENYLAVCCVD